MYRTAQETLVANRQQQLRSEAERARLVSRINHPEPRREHHVKHVLGLRLAQAR